MVETGGIMENETPPGLMIKHLAAIFETSSDGIQVCDATG